LEIFSSFSNAAFCLFVNDVSRNSVESIGKSEEPLVLDFFLPFE
jgi:hypothetical protein